MFIVANILISRNEFTELECYLTKEYEDLKSLWLEFSEQHAKAKSEEEVLIQMLREIRETAIKENSLDDHTDDEPMSNHEYIKNLQAKVRHQESTTRKPIATRHKLLFSLGLMKVKKK